MNQLKVSKLFKRKYCTTSKVYKYSTGERILCVYVGAIIANGIHEGVKNGSMALDKKKVSDIVLHDTIEGMAYGIYRASFLPLLIPIYAYHYIKE